MTKAGVISFVAASLMRAIGMTLRIRVEDRAGMMESPPDGPVLWLFWHNRVFLVPYLWRKYVPSRFGVVLTSASKDGEIIARTLARFGAGAVRGSTSRQSRAALVKLVERVRAGDDVAFTPDGPRGPRYQMQAGVVKIAQVTGAPVFPVHVRYSKAWELKTWDGFRIPVPFSRVDVIFDELKTVERTDSDEAFEVERVELERLLREGTGEVIDAEKEAARRKKKK
ncbi:MAG: lysophospholipid acyltransferase family protein [Verrucomicrobiales bacterium]|nr:lysophospholipid acyltransferase family protein [Verrucomicrobiales bacterium]